MNPERDKRRDEILEEVMNLPREEASAYLARACSDDHELCKEIERLLEVHRRQSEEFLTTAPHSWLGPRIAPGQKLGRYEVKTLIGTGGMSVVYLAEDPSINRSVALKVLLPGLGAADRFLREVRTLGGLRHEHIVDVHDFGEFGGMPYIVMEYLQGQDLAQALKEGTCGDLAWKLSTARQIAVALDHVHKASIIHRDIKPANIWIEPSGKVKLMDFGIARSEDTSMTQTGAIIGTPEYLPPELVKGQRSTLQSDIYSYGILLFELFTGKKAYQGNFTAEVLYKVVNQPIDRRLLREADLPLELEELIVRMTAKDPAQRIQSFEAVLTELSRTDLNGSPRKRLLRQLRTAKFALPLVAAAALAGIAFAVFHQRQPEPQPQATTASVQPRNEVQPPPPSVDHPEKPAQKTEPTPPSPVATTKPSNESRTGTAAPALVREKAPIPQSQSPVVAKPVSPAPLTVDPPPRTKLAAAPDVPTVSVPNFPQAQPPQTNTAEQQIAKNIPPPSLPSAATRKPDSAPDYSSARREILAMLQRYANAYRTKDFSEVSEIRKDLTDSQRKALRNAFSQPGSLTLQLDPQSGPDFGVVPDGQSPEKATVRCRRVVTLTAPNLRRPAVTEDVVTFQLARVNGEWRIVAGS